jgi:hypothetical protein
MLETRELLQYPSSCTFALIHEGTKMVVLYDTINFFKTLGEILNKLHTTQYDYPEFHDYKHELTIQVMSSEQDLDIRRQMFSAQIESFKNNGYTVLNRKTTLVKYTVRKIMTRYKKQTVVCVVRVNRRNNKQIMGIFHNVIEADRFIESLGVPGIVPIKHADNELTNDYLQSQYRIALRL